VAGIFPRQQALQAMRERLGLSPLVPDRLAAFDAGLTSAVNFLAPAVSLDEVKQTNVVPMKEAAQDVRNKDA
jgi:hypothetical protein